MDWLLHKYIGIISTRLVRFKKTSNGTFNFRCPICMDSEINKNKARGYIYTKQGKMSFHCHNCEASMSVPNLIKAIDQNVYNEYRLEKMRDEKTVEQLDYETFVEKMKKPVFLKDGPLKTLKKISQLSVEHPIKKLVDLRKIPTPYHAKLFACPNFKRFVNTLIPNKFDENALKYDETRLLIPFFDRNKNLHALQGRALGKSDVKYITIVLDESVPKLFGLDTVDFGRLTYVLEGPIDAMFLPNAIATAGGDLVTALKGFDKTNLVIVYDNEPRSPETINKLDKAIMSGYNVVIWPDNLPHKDINDMVLAGMSPEFITHIIKGNTHRDLTAKLKLSSWSKL